MSFDKPALIIDNGSYSIKAGFSCDNHPISIFRNIVGRPKYLCGKYGKEPYDVHIGDSAMEFADELELNHPVKNGLIVHWDNMERVWHHIFYRTLKCAPEDRAVLVANATLATLQEKIKTTELFFEVLNTPALCLQAQSTLSIYGSGLTTGVSVDMGYDSTSIVPVYEGGPIKFAIGNGGIAGAQVSEFLQSQLFNRGVHLNPADSDVIDGIKKELCYVSEDAIISSQLKNYTLPDGNVIDVSEEAFTAGELLFQPQLINREGPLPEAVIESVMRCDSDIRREIFDGVIPCGGLAMLPGLNTRLGARLEELSKTSVTIQPSSEAYCRAWLGAAVFANLPDVTKLWVMKKQYEEHGIRIVKSKFNV